MVRLPRTPRSSSPPGNNRETVELCVVGPKSIIPRSITVQTNLSNNWLNLFVNELELNVPLDQGIFVCNRDYCSSDPKPDKGWRCHLNEPIRNYVNHFERHRNKYTVRICRPRPYNSSGRRDNGATRTPRARLSTSGSAVQRRTQSTPGGGVQRNRSVATARFPSPQEGRRQPSIVIPMTTTRNSASNLSGVLTPNSQQSPDDTRLHDQSTLQLDTPEAPPENPIPPKRQRRAASQQDAATFAVVKQEVLQPPEDGVPTITDVRSILKFELPPPATSIGEQFYDEDDDDEEMETGVGGVETAGEAGSDPNVLEGMGEQGIGNVEPSGEEGQEQGEGEVEEQGIGNVEPSGEEGQEQGEEEGNGGGDFGGTSDTSEEGASWGDNDNQDEEGDEEEEDDDDDWDDGISMYTAVTQERIELREEGIQVEHIQSMVRGRFAKFSNDYMLRMKNEIKMLKKNKHWVKNVEKAPLACYFVQELFK